MKWFDTENRLIKIIKVLEDKSDLHINELARRLGTSTKTIQNDIKDINLDFRGCALIDLNRSIARLYITDYARYQKQRNAIEGRNSNFESSQMRMAFIMEMLMTADSPYLLDELAYAMNISRSTLIKDVNKLRGILENYSLQILGQVNLGICLKGEELNLRFFILDNTYSLLCAEESFPQELLAKIKENLRPLKLDRMVVENFFRYMTLSVDRMKQGHTLHSLDPKYQELSKHYYYQFLEPTFQAIEDKAEVCLSENEKLFLTIPFISMRTPYDISSLESNVKVSEDTLHITEEIIAAIREKMEIDLDEKNSDVLDEFVYHNYFLTNRLRYGLPMYRQSNEDIKEKYTVAYHMALIAKNVIENRICTKIPEQEVEYLTAYFQIFLNEQSSRKKSYRVALLCGTGRARAKLIMAQLQRIFDQRTQIDIIVYDEQFAEAALAGFDLLVSTVRQEFSLKIPVIFINEVVDEEYLRNSIEQILYAHELQIPLLHGVKSIVFNLLSDERVMVLNPENTYTENVRYMVDRLVSQGLVEAGFWTRIQEREAKSSMVLDRQIAFPHARHESGDDVVIALGLIPRRLKDELYPDLQVIFLVAIPSKPDDDGVLVKIYDEIISISSQQKVIEDLSKMTSYRDILLYFIKDCDLFI